MDPRAAAALAAAYVIGSIPFAYLAVRWRRGVDIRTVGSGNVGATNAGRVLGRGWAGAIYALDALKGACAVWLGRALAPSVNVEAGCGLLAIVGHVAPVWLRFRGGKGVATTTGVFLALAPLAFVIAGGVWLVVAAITRMVSLASVALAAALPVAVVALEGEAAFRERLATTLLAAVVALFVIVRHAPNLRRVAKGTEPRIGARRTP